MLPLRSRLRPARPDSGASAVEYAVLLSAIAALVVVVVFGLGGRIKSIIADTESCIGAKGVCTSAPTAGPTATPSATRTTAAPTPTPSSTRTRDNNDDDNNDGNNCGNNGGSGNGSGNTCKD